MKKRKLRIGVVGLGRAGWYFHCLPISEHPDFKLVGVVDPEKDRRIEGEKTFNCASFESYERMLNSVDLDAVVIATPTHLHKEFARAIRTGSDPLVKSREALAVVRMVERCRTDAGRIVTIG